LMDHGSGAPNGGTSVKTEKSGGIYSLRDGGAKIESTHTEFPSEVQRSPSGEAQKTREVTTC